jgi:hypothetical protein
MRKGAVKQRMIPSHRKPCLPPSLPQTHSHRRLTYPHHRQTDWRISRRPRRPVWKHEVGKTLTRRGYTSLTNTRYSSANDQYRLQQPAHISHSPAWAVLALRAPFWWHLRPGRLPTASPVRSTSISIWIRSISRPSGSHFRLCYTSRCRHLVDLFC